MLYILCLLTVIMISAGSAYCTNKVNKGFGQYWMGIVLTGFLCSLLWVVFSKITTNLFRDSLIWDAVVVTTFSLVLVYFGHTAKYEFYHWIGIGLLLIAFGYWLVIDNI